LLFYYFSIGCLIGLKIPFQTDTESLSFLSSKTKKVLLLKNNFLNCCQYQNKKALFTDASFSGGFGIMNDGSEFGKLKF